MTNYERIKAMTVEEMANFLENEMIADCSYCSEKNNCTKKSIPEAECLKGRRQWLSNMCIIC